MAKGDSGHPRMAADYPGVAEQAEGLKDKAREMASHLGESAGQMRDKAREFASGVSDRTQEAWRGAREGVQERFSSMGHRAGDMWGDATEFVRRYPIASLAVAFGLGCMTSCALSFLVRSDDDMAERMSRASS